MNARKWCVKNGKAMHVVVKKKTAIHILIPYLVCVALTLRVHVLSSMII